MHRTAMALCLALLAGAGGTEAQDKTKTVETLHQQAADAYQVGTPEALEKAVQLWSEALEICSDQSGCARQRLIWTNLSASYLGLAERDLALAAAGESLQRKDSDVLRIAAKLWATPPAEQDAAYVMRVRKVLDSAVPVRALTGLQPTTAEDAEGALEQLLRSLQVPIKIRAPSPMQARIRESPLSGARPFPWKHVTTPYERGYPFYRHKSLQICYEDGGAGAKAVIEDCDGGCDVQIPRADAAAGCKDQP